MVEVVLLLIFLVEIMKQQLKKQGKKNQKKEFEIFERWKIVKKEKWVEGVMVKGCNEFCSIECVVKIVVVIKGVLEEEVCEVVWCNIVCVFGLGVDSE